MVDLLMNGITKNTPFIVKYSDEYIILEKQPSIILFFFLSKKNIFLLLNLVGFITIFILYCNILDIQYELFCLLGFYGFSFDINSLRIISYKLVHYIPIRIRPPLILRLLYINPNFVSYGIAPFRKSCSL